MFDSSNLAPRVRGLKERLNSSRPEKIYNRLPEGARTILDIMQNDEILLQLISRYGGCTLNIPTKWPPNGKKSNYKGHYLRRVLTPTQMQKIVAHYGGTALYIPKCTKYIQLLRNRTIINTFSKQTKNGTSSGIIVQRLARRYRLSDRRIWDILKCNIENSTDESK